jgi:hypothetical protein
MTHLALRIAVPLAAAAMALLPPSPAQAAPGDVVYATVDAFEMSVYRGFAVTGIVEGQAQTTRTAYDIYSSNSDHQVALSRCDRMATLAMSKPGKYQLTLVKLGTSEFGCKLSLRAP